MPIFLNVAIGLVLGGALLGNAVFRAYRETAPKLSLREGRGAALVSVLSNALVFAASLAGYVSDPGLQNTAFVALSAGFCWGSVICLRIACEESRIRRFR